MCEIPQRLGYFFKWTKFSDKKGFVIWFSRY